MASERCERCGALPPPIAEGPFKGSRHELGYCATCSKDLCDACLRDGTCRDQAPGIVDGRHRVEADCKACAGAGCPTCGDSGTVLALVDGDRS